MENSFYLTDSSASYRAIPEEAAQRFGDLLIPELQKLGVEVEKVITDSDEYSVNPYWKKLSKDKQDFKGTQKGEEK